MTGRSRGVHGFPTQAGQISVLGRMWDARHARKMRVITSEEQIRIAIDYVRNVANGGTDERHIADDMVAWSLSGRYMPRSRYWPRLKNVKAIFVDPLEMKIDSITQQADKVVLQARSRGILFTGQEYSNEYLFLIEFNSDGKIRYVREYFDVEKLRTILMPALLQWEKDARSDLVK